MKKAIIILLIIILIIIGGLILRQRNINFQEDGESNEIKENIAKENSVEETNSLEEKEYYLHDSNLEVASDEKCSGMKKKVLEGLNKEQISQLSNKIRRIHMTMENLLIDGIWTLKDPTSKYWKLYAYSNSIIEDTGIELEFTSEYCFKYVLDNMKSIKDTLQEKESKTVLEEYCIRFENALNKRSIGECFEIHKIIHDFDYFMINYPAQFDKVAPADWEGIRTYFGTEI